VVPDTGSLFAMTAKKKMKIEIQHNGIIAISEIGTALRITNITSNSIRWSCYTPVCNKRFGIGFRAHDI